MSGATIELMMGWALFVLTAVSLIIFIKMIALFGTGKIKTAFACLGGIFLWVVYTLFLVYIAIVSGMNHASAHDADKFVVVLLPVHTFTAVVILFFMFRKNIYRTS